MLWYVKFTLIPFETLSTYKLFPHFPCLILTNKLFIAFVCPSCSILRQYGALKMWKVWHFSQFPVNGVSTVGKFELCGCPQTQFKTKGLLIFFIFFFTKLYSLETDISGISCGRLSFPSLVLFLFAYKEKAFAARIGRNRYSFTQTGRKKAKFFFE